MARIPVDPDETLRLIERFDRTPFQEALAAHLGCQPTPDALQRFADKYPDRYWQGATMLWRLAGGTDAPVVSVSVQVKMRAMSDAQLAKELGSVMQRIAALESRKALPQHQSNQALTGLPQYTHTVVPPQEAEEPRPEGGGAAPRHEDADYSPPARE